MVNDKNVKNLFEPKIKIKPNDNANNRSILKKLNIDEYSFTQIAVKLIQFNSSIFIPTQMPIITPITAVNIAIKNVDFSRLKHNKIFLK